VGTPVWEGLYYGNYLWANVVLDAYVRIEALREPANARRATLRRGGRLAVLATAEGLLLGSVEAMSVGRALPLHGGQGRIYTAQLRGTPKTLPNGDRVLLPDYAANETLLRAFRE
jgi:hypothetical protein